MESAHQARRLELNRVFNRVVSQQTNNNKQNDPKNPVSESNLTLAELDGLKSLKKKIKEGKLLICETDKSKRFAVMRPQQYIEAGKVHTDRDIEISPDQIKRVQNSVNDHCWWFNKISNIGSNWGHEDRMNRNLNDKGEQSCNMVLLVKDHKGWAQDSGKPPPSRPVVSGNTGLNCHLSELLSMVLEPVTKEAQGSDVDSTNELLHRVELLNSKLTDESTIINVDEPVVVEPKLKSPVKLPNSAKCKVNGKGDIRFYGSIGMKTESNKAKIVENAKTNVEKLRNTRSDGLVPNLSDRVKAGHLIDKIEDDQPLKFLTMSCL